MDHATYLVASRLSLSLTWDHVSEADGGHGDEGEVEGVEEGPLPLPDLEDERRHREENGEGNKAQEVRQDVLPESHLNCWMTKRGYSR